MLPTGKFLKLKIRHVDVENVRKLRKMDNITVFESVEEIKKIITGIPESEKSVK